MAKSLFDLTGKTAVVLGGTSGIGKTIALGLADAGADVAASGRRQSHVESVASEIEARGHKALRIATDVRQRETLVALRDEALRVFGKVDILVNAAGVTQKIPTLDMPENVWNDILDTN